MKTIILLSLLISNSLMGADKEVNTFHGKIENASGEMRRFSNVACDLSITSNLDESIDVVISVAIPNQGVGAMDFRAQGLIAKFSGSDIYAPKYELKTLRGVKDSIIIHMNPRDLDREEIMSAEAFKIGSNFNYSFECVIQ